MNVLYQILDRIWQGISERVFVRFEFELPIADLKKVPKESLIFSMSGGGLVEWLIVSSWCRREGLGPILITNRMSLLILGKPLIWFSVLTRKRTLSSTFLGSDTFGPRMVFLKQDERRRPFSPSSVELLLAQILSQGVASTHAFVIVPVVITWRKYLRGAARHPSEYLFGLSSRPNIFGKAWYLARRRKDSTVRGLTPITDMSPAATVDYFGEDDAMRAAKSVRRRILVAINEETRVLLGPRYISPTSVKETILHDADVQSLLNTLSGETQTDKKKLMLQAYRVLAEISANYSYRFVEVLYVALSWFFTRVFDGLDSVRSEMDGLRAVAKQKPVILVSAHRSHLDYLVVPYLLFEEDIVTPHIAAGVNLMFWPIGGFLRKGGAFFIRRSFRGDRLYGLLLMKYISLLIQNRFNILFFIEGTRSRSGKMLPPAYGMLKMILECFQSRLCDDIALVPVSISYDEVLEQRAYARELEGGQKVKENARELIKSRSIISKNIGKVYVRLAQSLSVKEIIRESSIAGFDDRRTLQKAAFEICARINNVTPITPKALLSTTLLVQTGGLTLEQIGTLSRNLLAYAVGSGHPVSAPEPESARRAIELLLRQMQRSGLVQSLMGAMPMAFELAGARRTELVFYRNNAIHCFVIPSIAYLSLRLVEHESVFLESRVIDRALEIRNFLKHDFFFSPSREFIDQIRSSISKISEIENWSVLSAQTVLGSIQQVWGGQVGENLFQALLGDLIEGYLLAFRMIGQSPGLSVDRKGFQQRLLKESQSMNARGELQFPETASLQVFGGAIQALENLGMILPDPNGTKQVTIQSPSARYESALAFVELLWRQVTTARSKIY